MSHELVLEQSDRETWTATCSCGRWLSRFSLDDIPIEQTGDLRTIAADELGRRHQEHVAGT